jgi:hypothetical protein
MLNAEILKSDLSELGVTPSRVESKVHWQAASSRNSNVR